jgi:hypothetical protein
MGGLLYLANDTQPLRDFVDGLLGLETASERAAREQKQLEQWTNAFTEAMKGNQEYLDSAPEAVRKLYEAKEYAAGIDERLAEGVRFSNKSYEEQIQILEEAGEAQKLLDEINRDGAERDKQRTEAVKVMAEAWGEFTQAQKDSLTESERQTYAAAAEEAERKGLLKVLEDTKDAKEEENKALEKEAALRKQASDELFRQTQLVYDHQEALEQIRSDERLKIIELKFNMELEELRLQSQQAISIIEGINNTITSTGETLTDLAGLLGGFSSTSSSGYREMMEIVEDESRRRDEALAMQRQLTEAQAELMDAQADAIRARTEAFDRGDAAIQIDGAGLQPHLEAFMWEVLQSIQTRVNAEGYDMLLGYEGGTT